MATSEDPIHCLSDNPRVIAVDDQAQFRLLMRRVVDATPGFEMVAEADSGEAAVAVVHELRPDLVLMDIEMPGLGGCAAARRIKGDLPSTVVVLVGATHPDDLSAEAGTCLADEIVWKPKLRPALLEAIWQSRRGADAVT
jgi:DNA-binding NarL/FixJ family response regulator